MEAELSFPAELSWQISVPLLRSAVIVRQLGIALGLPLGMVALVLLLTSGRSVYTLYALGMIAALLLFSWLLLLAVYRGRYEAEFVLSPAGALCRTQAAQAKKNRILNALTVALGLLSGRPSVSGAGLLAQSRQSVTLRWNRVRRVACHPRQYTILLRGGPAEQLALFCTPENYEEVWAFVTRKIPKSEVRKS